jgi:hypothetical protein
MEDKFLIAKILIFVGVLMILFGLLIPFTGKLPGDIYFKKGNFSFYFPLATCLILSLIFSLIFYLISRFLK